MTQNEKPFIFGKKTKITLLIIFSVIIIAFLAFMLKPVFWGEGNPGIFVLYVLLITIGAILGIGIIAVLILFALIPLINYLRRNKSNVKQL
jgi:hypothetical protein